MKIKLCTDGREYEYYEDKEPCLAPFCINHQTKPCENCHRIGCNGEAWLLKRKQPYKWEIK